MAKAQVGSGNETSFGKISGAKLVPMSADSDGVRNGITKRVTSTACGVPDYGPGLAGGSSERFDELKNTKFGPDSKPKTDSDYTVVKTHMRRLPSK